MVTSSLLVRLFYFVHKNRPLPGNSGQDGKNKLLKDSFGIHCNIVTLTQQDKKEEIS